MASLKDVSKLAGVSPSTVSRVITGTIPVDNDTKIRVMEAIQELNYRPNLLARGLRNKSGKSIGLMVPSILHETFSNFISYVEQACVDLGFTMILGNTRADPAAEERILENFIGMNVDGIIISRVSDSSAVMENLKKLGIPVVGIDRALENENADRVVVGNKEAGQMAARYLYAMGHRQIACIGGPQTVSLSRERSDGFNSFFAEKGVEVQHVAGSDFEYETGIILARKLLEQGCEFTALWAQSDLLAIGAIRELQRLGVKIPENVSVMGMDDIKTGQMLLPALTTVQQPFQKICHKAVNLLLERIKDPTSERRYFILPPKLIVRDSVSRRQAT